jgi:hypothetical protein
VSQRRPSFYGTGVVCSLGAGREAIAGYEMGACGFEKARGLCGIDAMPPILAWVYPNDQPRDFAERLALLLNEVLNQCLPAVQSTGAQGKVALHILFPEWMSRSKLLIEDVLRRIGQQHKSAFNYPETHFGSHAEGLNLMSDIAKSIASGTEDIAVACAVDSYIHSDLLDRLSVSELILNRENPYGFVPGEGAGALVISTDEFVKGHAQPVGILKSARTAIETEDVKAPKGVMGRGLADCFEGSEDHRISRLMADLNGERHRAEEFGFAIAARGQHLMHVADNPETPALQIGDLGAATGLVYAALALGNPSEESDAAGQCTLISTSSRSGRRFTMIIERR